MYVQGEFKSNNENVQTVWDDMLLREKEKNVLHIKYINEVVDKFNKIISDERTKEDDPNKKITPVRDIQNYTDMLSFLQSTLDATLLQVTTKYTKYIRDNNVETEITKNCGKDPTLRVYAGSMIHLYGMNTEDMSLFVQYVIENGTEPVPPPPPPPPPPPRTCMRSRP